MSHLEFDASVALHNHLRDAGVPRGQEAEAVEAVRSALRSMPGAGMVDVEYVGPCPPDLRFFCEAEWVTLYRRWNATPMQGGEWELLRQSTVDTIKRALVSLPHAPSDGS